MVVSSITRTFLEVQKYFWPPVKNMNAAHTRLVSYMVSFLVQSDPGDELEEGHA